MTGTTEPEDTIDANRTLSYRCSCGSDVQLPVDGQGTCANCGRRITLSGLDATQTVSFCSEVGSTTTLQLASGSDRSGEELGHFRLISKLGHGGMGAVYRALDESLQRFVAVKVMRSPTDGGSSSARQVTRLLDEAVAQARLNHPNVVTIYYVGRAKEEPFFAMELLPGPTLEVLSRDGPLPYEDVIHYARQISGALREADRLGLVHGDIKSSNLILAGDKTVKLGDFGLAKMEHSSPTQGISGTLSYMAPELADGGEPSAKSDMYSLGVTLFELTFGRRPYTVFGSTLREQLDNHRGVEVEFPEKWPNTVPARWRVVLERLLAKSPDDRYDDYDALERDLNALAPVGVTNAGLLNRGLAYLVDMIMLGILMLPLSLPAHFASQISAQLTASGAAESDWPGYLRIFSDRLALVSVLAPIIPAAAAWAEWRGVRTLGRYLFQLRVVDAHGLRLERRKRVLRSVIRFAPFWIGSVAVTALALGFDMAVFWFAPLDEIVLLVNTLPVLGPRRLALHDRLLGSRVVLDTEATRK